MRGLTLLAREMARLGEEAGAEISILLLPAHPNAGRGHAYLASEWDPLTGTVRGFAHQCNIIES